MTARHVASIRHNSLGAEVQHTHEAGNAGVVGATAQTRQGQQHPQESARASASRAQLLNGLEPVIPKRHRVN